MTPNPTHTHKYTVATSRGDVKGAFHKLQDAIEYADSRVNKYRELFVRDTLTFELMHYAKRDW